MFGENFRGIHALQLLTGSRGWTLERLQAAAFDSLSAGVRRADPAAGPGLRRAAGKATRGAQRLAAPDRAAARLGLSLGRDSRRPDRSPMFWGDAMSRRRSMRDRRRTAPTTYAARIASDTHADAEARRARRGGRPAHARLRRLARAVGRGQPLPAHLAARSTSRSDDTAPSIAGAVRLARVGLARLVRRGRRSRARSDGTAPTATASSRWSSSASASAPGRSPRAAKAAIRRSPHFNDEAQRYASGDLREVYFYPDQLRATPSGPTARASRARTLPRARRPRCAAR